MKPLPSVNLAVAKQLWVACRPRGATIVQLSEVQPEPLCSTRQLWEIGEVWVGATGLSLPVCQMLTKSSAILLTLRQSELRSRKFYEALYKGSGKFASDTMASSSCLRMRRLL